MKLLIVLLLVLPMIGANDQDETTTTESYHQLFDKTVKDPELLKDYLRRENNNRIECAKTFNISNMHELTWDEGLAKLAENYGKTCPDVHKHGSNYRQWNSAESWRLSKSIKDALDKEVTEGSNLGGDEPHLPHQTKFGCAYSKCHEIICNYGPHSDWKYTDFKRGRLATECPGAKTETEMLCRASTPPMSKSSASATPTILAGISLVSLLF